MVTLLISPLISHPISVTHQSTDPTDGRTDGRTENLSSLVVNLKVANARARKPAITQTRLRNQPAEEAS